MEALDMALTCLQLELAHHPGFKVLVEYINGSASDIPTETVTVPVKQEILGRLSPCGNFASSNVEMIDLTCCSDSDDCDTLKNIFPTPPRENSEKMDIGGAETKFVNNKIPGELSSARTNNVNNNIPVDPIICNNDSGIQGDSDACLLRTPDSIESLQLPDCYVAMHDILNDCQILQISDPIKKSGIKLLIRTNVNQM